MSTATDLIVPVLVPQHKDDEVVKELLRELLVDEDIELGSWFRMVIDDDNDLSGCKITLVWSTLVFGMENAPGHWGTASLGLERSMLSSAPSEEKRLLMVPNRSNRKDMLVTQLLWSR